MRTYLKEIGIKVRSARKSAGMKQYELARKINVERGTISSIELGRFATRITTLKQIADVLNVSMKEFV